MTDPGLDINSLRALLRPQHSERAVLDRIDAHLDAHDGYLAFSGGKDSTVVLHLARQVDPNVPVCFFNSGLEYPETLTYIADLAKAWKLNLEVIDADPSALEILAASGGWAHHTPDQRSPSLHETLIKAPSSNAHRRHGAGELWGVRASESHGRRAAYGRALKTETAHHCSPTHCASPAAQRERHGGTIRRQDGTVAFGPVWNWSDTNVWAYLERHQIPINPVYRKLQELHVPQHFQRISHVVDGDFLEQGRIVWLKRGWPDLYEQIRRALPRLSEYL